jgi:putative spermidine/putrescine transport system permease protein
MSEVGYHRSWTAAGLIVVVFILAPIAYVIFGSFTSKEYLDLPFSGASLRWYTEILDHQQFVDGFVKSIQLALVAALMATALGTLAAIGLSRSRSRLMAGVSLLMLLPIIVPSVITAIALLQYFTSLRITTPYVTLFVGHTIITLPYVVRTAMASLALVPRNLDWAAANLGASPAKVIWRVTIPNIKPGVIGAFIFAFVVSFDTVTLSIFLQTPSYIPLPVRLYNFVETGVSPVIAALSSLLVLFSGLGIYVAHRIASLDVILGTTTSGGR